MDLNKLAATAREMMDENGLQDWSFSFDSSIRRLGLCNYTRRKISMSRSLSAVNDEVTCMDTILHEIAHAVVGPRNGHNAVWRAKAVALGCDPRATVSASSVATVEKRWLAKCSCCGASAGKYQRRDFRLVCRKCYNSKNGYNKLEFYPNPRGGMVVLAA